MGKEKKGTISRRDFLKGTAAGTMGVAAAGVLGACAGVPESASRSGGQGGYMDSTQAQKKWRFEIPPAPITNIAETISADVVVLGAGTAGLITAVSAQEAGLKVALVSASSKPISRGGSNNAAYSKVMQKLGIPRYSPEQIRKEIAMNYNSVDQKKWYTHYNQSETAMNWLIDIMAEAGYECALEQGPVITPDDIYYTAPGAHGFINDENKSVGMTQPFVVNTLAAKLQALGGKIYYKNIGRQLVRGGAANGTSGRVTAVIAEREDGRFVKYEGTKAVVLATGDFSADREMMTKYSPWCAKYISDEVYDSPMNYDKEFVMGGLYRGDGHKMGLWAGAAWQKTFPNAPMGGTIGAGPSPIVYDPFFGLMVDRNGERFMNEYASSQLSGRTQWLQMGEKSYAIWDRDFVKTSDKWFPAQGGIGIMQPISSSAEVIARWDSLVESGQYKRANTLEALVDALGLPREKALQTISRYNELCDKKADTDFYKRPDKLIAIKTAPFYGAVSGEVGLLCVLGGLRTNAYMQVCDESDNPIPGLYNIGTMVGDFYAGLYTFQMEGINYGATCITFGYLAGKHIAANE